MNFHKLLMVLFWLGAILQGYGQQGALDPTFGEDGIAYNDTPGYNWINNAMTLQNDGKIIVGGGGSGAQFGITRYNTDGTLDETFSDDGMASVFIANVESYVNAVAVGPNGKIAATGRHYHLNPDGSKQTMFATARLNPDGSIDTSFGDDGVIINNLSNSHHLSTSIAIQNDNKVLVGGGSQNSNNISVVTILRFTNEGNLDSSFDNDGIVKTQVGTSGSGAYDILLQPDGKILVASISNNGNNIDFALLRYLPNGSLDTSFGTNGIVTTNFGANSNERVEDLALQPDGKIIAAGTTDNGTSGTNDFAVVRYLPNGNIDTNFGDNGVLIADVAGNRNDRLNAVALNSDGKIVISGMTYADEVGLYRNAMIRLLSNGQIDLAAGANGRVISDLKTDWYFNDSNMEIQSDQKIVVAGDYRNENNETFQIVIRYLPELVLGTIDFSISKAATLIYPNPIASETTLEYTLSQAETISITLYDVSGKLIRTFLSSEEKEAGDHKQTLNFDGIATGNYVLKLSNGSGQFSLQILKK
ncbi:T9SS type A sorting domain-containing protein [Altibacter lentus]|uniref:T9SS type A sorting domain-containing protein n=1 Tax=Altibacter lentus TaxID=1223410 RepID=UPI00068AC09C|nr:T9SS type A sorting domain-containing protein [Altibacter lentus]